MGLCAGCFTSGSPRGNWLASWNTWQSSISRLNTVPDRNTKTLMPCPGSQMLPGINANNLPQLACPAATVSTVERDTVNGPALTGTSTMLCPCPGLTGPIVSVPGNSWPRCPTGLIRGARARKTRAVQASGVLVIPLPSWPVYSARIRTSILSWNGWMKDNHPAGRRPPAGAP